MEKFMRFNYLRENLLFELIEIEKLQMVLNCPYGCYVMKTAAEMSDQQNCRLIKSAIVKVYPILHQKKLQMRWDEIISICELLE
jgi:hypothetical protein